LKYVVLKAVLYKDAWFFLLGIPVSYFPGRQRS